MAGQEDGGKVRELLELHRSVHGERLESGRDGLILAYFRSYLERTRRVLYRAETLSGEEGGAEPAARLKERAYWIMEKTRLLEQEHPWLRIIGMSGTAGPGVAGPVELPGHGERDRAYGLIRDRVYLLDSMLWGLEREPGADGPVEAGGDPPGPDGGTGPS
ncbi:MAG: hypothetical protein LBQ79_06070 [Deltaproteobacteria bacterium]|jgi:hypothetical protein|nr:hypothetical protein [Deltaproteobacteria bacterium]